jgi:hypothetical protein
MPEIALDDIDLDQALTNVIASIALEEAALSHILNAEGEKIQAAVAIPTITADELIGINNAVSEVMDAVSQIESALQEKLNVVMNAINPSP